MATSNHTINALTIGIIIFFCCGYVIFILTKLIRKYQQNIQNFLLKVQEKIPWIKTDLHPFMEKIGEWWGTRFIPAARRGLETLWAKETWLGYLLEIIVIVIWGLYVGLADRTGIWFLHSDALYLDESVQMWRMCFLERFHTWRRPGFC